MTLNLTIPNNINDTKPRISVIGIGGAGGNAVNTMINSHIENIEFIVANTDGQALSHSLTKRQIQLGKNTTMGLGAGSNAETGRKAAEESIDEIISELGDINMLFITTGMGGGTGSGASPIIAKAAKEKGILTVAVVTKPFDFEGQKRMEVAEEGLKQLKDNVDTLIVIPNQNLFKIANDKTTFSEAFKMADDVLYQGVCGITDLITNPGMINLDFADIKTVMGNMGKAMMGTGESSGDERAKKAAEAALSNPLLDNSNIKGAKSILLNIKGGPDMALFEVDEAATKIRNEVDENANIIFGSSISESLEGIIRVSVVATGIDSNINILKETVDIKSKQEENLPNQSSINQDKILNVEKTTMNTSEQIDLETQINERDDELKIKTEQFDVSSISANKNIKELGDIIDKKPNNNLTSNRPENILKRLSTFFKNENINEIKVEPNFKNTSKINDEFSNKKEINETEFNKIKDSNNFNELKNEDLFKPQKEENISEQQISLIGIEQNEEDIDENILEIPAFLRRQAN